MIQADHRAFSLESAVALTGFSERQLRAWARDGFFCPFYWTAENASDPYRPIFYSFRDLVGLRTIAILRKEHKVSLQRLRKFGQWLKARYDEPWSTLTFKVVGKELYFDDPDTGVPISSNPAGQTIAPQVIRLERIAQDVERKVAQLWKRPKDKVGHIAPAKGVMGNVPVVAGTRIPASAIREFHDEGYSLAQIKKEYPQLTDDDIKAAIKFGASSSAAVKRRKAG